VHHLVRDLFSRRDVDLELVCHHQVSHQTTTRRRHEHVDEVRMR
jgi:hypothetical protein